LTLGMLHRHSRLFHQPPRLGPTANPSSSSGLARRRRPSPSRASAITAWTRETNMTAFPLTSAAACHGPSSSKSSGCPRAPHSAPRLASCPNTRSYRQTLVQPAGKGVHGFFEKAAFHAQSRMLVTSPVSVLRVDRQSPVPWQRRALFGCKLTFLTPQQRRLEVSMTRCYGHAVAVLCDQRMASRENVSVSLRRGSLIVRHLHSVAYHPDQGIRFH
jgi:hypothetical protein